MNKEALINFFLEPDDIDEETAIIYLAGRGINPAESAKEFMDLIIEKRVELKIHIGEELQKQFDNGIKSGISEAGDQTENNFRLAARNFEGLSDKDKKIVKENLVALGKAKEKKNEKRRK